MPCARWLEHVTHSELYIAYVSIVFNWNVIVLAHFHNDECDSSAASINKEMIKANIFCITLMVARMGQSNEIRRSMPKYFILWRLSPLLSYLIRFHWLLSVECFVIIVKIRDNDLFLSLLWISGLVGNWIETRCKYQCKQWLSESFLK